MERLTYLAGMLLIVIGGAIQTSAYYLSVLRADLREFAEDNRRILMILIAVAVLTFLPLGAIEAGFVDNESIDGVFTSHVIFSLTFLIALSAYSFRFHSYTVIVLLVVVAMGLIWTFAEFYGFYPVGTDETCLFLFRDRLYFSIVTFTTLGYGDFKPFPETRLVAGIQALYGMVFVGLLVGLLVARMWEGTREWERRLKDRNGELDQSSD